jgi:hypothetical protein
MYHGNETDHRTKDYPIYIDTKRKMNQDTTQPSPQLQSREVNHTMQWAPHNQQHSPFDPRIIQHKHTKIPRPNLQHITNHTTTSLPTTPNLRQLHK